MNPDHLHLVEPPEDPYAPTTPTNHDPHAEAALLNLLFTNPNTAHDIHANLDPDDFWRPEHETIWTTWNTLNDRDGVPPDPVTLASHLNRTRQTRAARAVIEIGLLRGSLPHADHYIQTIRDHSRLRTAQAAARAITQELHTGTIDTLDRALADALDTLESAALRFGPRDTNTRTGLADLTWVATTGQAPEQPKPVYGRRTDHTALFYPAAVNGVFGDPEHGKTWLAQIAIVEALTTEHETAAFIDTDHNGADATAARLILLGAPIAAIADPNRFRYYSPEDRDELLAAVDDVTNRRMNVVLIDSLGEVFPMLGVSTNDSDELSTAMRQVCTRPANAGACVITIDHLPKGADARGTGFAIGGIAKKRMIRGAYIRAEAKTQPTPGGIGRIALRIEKDTTGELRKSSGGSYAGTLILDSTQPHATTWTIEPGEAPARNEDGTFRPTVVMEQISRFVESNPEATAREIENAIPGKGTRTREALKLLIQEQWIARTPGPRNSFQHHTLKPFRRHQDPVTHPANDTPTETVEDTPIGGLE